MTETQEEMERYRGRGGTEVGRGEGGEGTSPDSRGRFAYQCVWAIRHRHAHVSAGSSGILVPSML